jgi:yecA family protein
MDWSLVNSALRRRGIATDAAENHGVLCGLLCARGTEVRQAWLALLREEAGAETDAPAGGEEAEADAGAWEELSRLYAETLAQLRDEGFAFYLLLPDDDQPLDLRAEAMTEWCQGFLYGLAAGGLEDYSVLPDEVREIVEDIVEISQAATDSGAGESDETAYAELIEYLRVGVILVFEALEAERGTRNDDRVIH